MKQAILHLTKILTLLSLLLAGCSPTPTAPPADGTEPANSAAFTIQADADLQEPVSALFQAYFPDEEPSFVSEGADLLVTHAPAEQGIPAVIPATFLPGAVLLPQTASADVTDFITFALSPDGQQVLIDLGALPEAVTLTDQAGNAVSIPQPVRRVMSTYGPATAIVYTVGAQATFVSASYLGARDPLGSAAMARIDPRFEEIIGDAFFTQDEFNLEEAARRDPDLILTSARTIWLDTAAELEIPFFLYEAETPDKLKEAVSLTGALFGPNAAARAQAWIAYFDSVEETIRTQTESIPPGERPRVLFTGTEPLRVASGDMFQTDLIEIAGGVSVSDQLTGYWKDVNLEQVAAWDPDIIIVPPYGGASVEAITESPEWQILDAVQAGKVYRMPKLVVPWDTPAPDSILGIVWLAGRLFPDQVDLTCKEEAKYFYNTYYDYAISEEELGKICPSE